MDALHLPDEIVEEILSNLQVKSLLRFRCVSKSWCCLIGSKRFIKTHLHKSKTHHPKYERWQAIFICNSQNPNPQLKRCSLHSYSSDPSVTPLPIDDPINNLITDSKIVGHSNGLVCILNRPASLFFLWNPATRISIQLPKLDCDCIRKLGFGWDDQSDEYKVFAVLSKKNENEWTRMGKIYSSKTDSWKTVEQHGSVYLLDRVGEFVCGRMHWLVRSGYIETFDLKSEVFGRIELPCEKMVGDRLRLYSNVDRGGCLWLVYDDCGNAMRKVWEIKKDGEKEVWVEVCGGPIPCSEGSTYMVCGNEKGVVKFSTRGNIVDCLQTCFYIESLVPPVSDKNA